jgi:hypothetical protein
MMHISEGNLQAYHDQELEAGVRRKMEAHLAGCTRCQGALQGIQERSQEVGRQIERLSDLPPDPLPGREGTYPPTPSLEGKGRVWGEAKGDTTLTPGPSPWKGEGSRSISTTQQARVRLEERLSQAEKEQENMSKQSRFGLSRSAWIGISLAVVLVVITIGALAIPQVRAAANSFLGLFRVERIQVIQVDSTQLPGELNNSPQLKALISDNVKVDEKGKPQEAADPAQASALAGGLPVRLPAEVQGAQGETLARKLMVQPGGSMSFTINLELLRGVLKDLNRTDIVLPDSLEGAKVSMDMPASVLALYGDCKVDQPDEKSAAAQAGPDMPDYQPSNCVSFMQTRGPTISAPPELDVQALGTAYLQVLGMTQDEAAKFAQNVDWANTFVVPIPRNGFDSSDVSVDGVQGTLLSRKGYGGQYVLMWVKDGIVYALMGNGKGNNALNIAATIQ